MKKILLVCLLALAGCSATRVALPDKAVVDVATVREAIRMQQDADANSDVPPPEGKPWFKVLEGPVPIIVTAPHATKPFRDGQYRFSDGGGTAALAGQLHKLTGVTVIYTTFASPSDPNYDDDNAFKDTLKQLIARKHPVLLLDLHGSHAYRPYDVDLGTMNGKSLLGNEAIASDLARALRTEGLINISGNYFAASTNRTITRFASALGVPAVQMEISTTWLVPGQSDLAAHRFAQLLQAVVRYVEAQKGRIAARP